jgi:hypothetical protein
MKYFALETGQVLLSFFILASLKALCAQDIYRWMHSGSTDQ